MKTLLSRFIGLFARRRRDEDLATEIRAHLDELAEEHARRGLAPDDAHAAARRDFGGVDQLKERYRDQRGVPVVETLWADIRYAARTLCRTPGFTLAAVAILGLGIGATAAIFSLVDAALIRPLPFRDPDRIVALWERLPRFERNTVAPLNYLEWSEQSTSFSSMAASTGGGTVTLSDTSGIAQTFPALNVSPAFFDVLGITPVAGRLFVDDDVKSGRQVAVVSERAWRSRFGADPRMVGRTLMFSGGPTTIIGIVPAAFQVLAPADFWMTYGPIPRVPFQRRNHFLRVFARLKPGVSIEQARAESAGVAANLARESPATNKDAGITVEPLRQSIVGDDLRTTTIVLAGVVAFVLLLACANVANLLLARGIRRTREVAVRAALGGSRWRIVHQFLVENLLLASLGGIAGIVLAWAIIRVAPSVMPPGTIPEGVVPDFDGRLVVFAAALTQLTALAAGLVPTWRAARVPLAEAMGAGGRGATTHAGVFRHALTVVEIAAAVLLATGAGLLVRTLISLNNVDAGYRADHVLTLQVSLELARYRTPESRMAIYQALADEMSSVPGVRLVAHGFDVPFDGWGAGQPFTVVGGSVDGARQPPAHYQLVSPRYFEAIGIPVLRGRAFTDRDTSGSTPVCIVNEELVRRMLPDRDPIGALVNVQSLDLAPRPSARQIVGVVSQVKERPNTRIRQMEIYVPQAQNSWFNSTIVVRTNVDAASLVPALRAAASRVRRDLAPTRIRTMEEVAAESTAMPRFRARLVGAFAALAMLLAAAGIFSVFTFTVQQRTREFSIRMALGAHAGDIVRDVLKSGARVVALGLAVGTAAALGLVRSMASLLFAVTPFDPLTFAGSSALLAVIALVACAVPAFRAAQADPAVALRQD